MINMTERISEYTSIGMVIILTRLKKIALFKNVILTAYFYCQFIQIVCISILRLIPMRLLMLLLGLWCSLSSLQTLPNKQLVL